MQIKCRKCNGPHFTVKCGQEEIINNNSVKKQLESINSTNNSSNNSSNNNSNNNTNNSSNNNSNTFKVKITDLPNDITDREMSNLLYEWGETRKLKVLNYNDNSVVYVEFLSELHANHFIKALHKTIFDRMVISIIRIPN